MLGRYGRPAGGRQAKLYPAPGVRECDGWRRGQRHREKVPDSGSGSQVMGTKDVADK